MRIAITGATGFLGRYIVAHLTEQGHECQCWRRPKSDLSGMQVARFQLPTSGARDDAQTRRRFHEAQESQYRRLLDEGLVGAAWFRHRLRQARVAQGKPADWSAGSLHSLSLDDTFSLLAPERGFSERMPLSIAELPAAKERQAADADEHPFQLARPFGAVHIEQDRPVGEFRVLLSAPRRVGSALRRMRQRLLRGFRRSRSTGA